MVRPRHGGLGSTHARHRIGGVLRLSTAGGSIDMMGGLRYSPTVFRLLPREEKFFDLFEQQGANIVAAARALEALTLDYAQRQDARAGDRE
jgi:hypothetical protein